MNKERYNRMVDYLNILCKDYYEHGNSPVADSVYDQLYDEIKKYEETHTPRKDSPTQRVGSGSSKSV